ncbi:MAG: hypothetical protein WBR18_12375 [Anaerolineales bacterium]
MPMLEDVLFCDGCGAEIVGAPIVRGKMMYCCEECSAGLECDCALVLDDDRGEYAEVAESNLGAMAQGTRP